MNGKLKKIKRKMAQFAMIRGIYFSLVWIYKYPFFIRDYFKFRAQSSKNHRLPPKIKDLFPRLFDNTSSTGFDPHYVYHPAWAARIVAMQKPAKHIDISSTLHFCTLLSAFVPTEFYDYRPADLRLSNLVSKKGDLTALPFADDSIESLSCMHTIEHIGLGRYGDLVDSEGDMKAARELARVLKPGGTFLFAAPMGIPRVCFNAHRIYSYEQVIELFPMLEVREFSLIPDDWKTNGLIKNADPKIVKDQSYACGCFWFVKK